MENKLATMIAKIDRRLKRKIWRILKNRFEEKVIFPPVLYSLKKPSDKKYWPIKRARKKVPKKYLLIE
nr:hypothetical protein [Enterococcus durans]